MCCVYIGIHKHHVTNFKKNDLYFTSFHGGPNQPIYTYSTGPNVGPKLLSKTPLNEIKSKNPVSSQQNELQSIIDPMNKALMQNQEIKTEFSRTITANNFV